MSPTTEDEAATLQARRNKLQQDRLLIQQQLATRQAMKQCHGDPQLEECLRRLLQFCKNNKGKPIFQLFAFNLYCSRPKLYRQLKSILQLPNENVLQNYKLYLSPDFEDCILYFLSSKLSSLSLKINHFVLCVEQHPLNRNFVYDTKRDILLGLHNMNGMITNKSASTAYVMMMRSLCVNWVQPVSFAFRNFCYTNQPHFFTWCLQVITKLLEIGIQVEAVVFNPLDSNPVNVNWNRQDNNRINFTFRDTKVVELHDIRMLLEDLRNCLIDNDFYYHESRISWHYIKLMYYHQKNCDSELIPDLKEVHVYPSTGHCCRWKHARAVFSSKVFLALNKLINSGVLPHEARPTANFVKAMSELYEMANYSPRSSRTITVKQQVDVLERTAEIFRNIHMRSGTNVPATIAHMHVTLKAMATLLQDLVKKGFETVYTSRLNKAPVDAFFRAVPRTEKRGRRLKPTASQVYKAFTEAFTRSLRRRTRWTRPEDLAEATACGLLDPRRLPAAALPHRSPLRLPPGVDYRVPLPRVHNAAQSLLLDMCIKFHTCPQLEESIERCDLLIDNMKIPEDARELWGRLVEPPFEFVRFVDDMEDRMQKLLKKNVYQRPGTVTFRELLRAKVWGMPCACFPRRLLLRLLVRRKIWLALRRSNDSLRRNRRGRLISFTSGERRGT